MKLFMFALFICIVTISHAQFTSLESITDHTLGAKGIEVMDVDNDGLKDVISISTVDSKLAWYKQLPSGDFDFQQLIPGLLGPPIAIAISDLDGNGFDDIVYSTQFNGIVWIDNQGDLAASAHNILTTQHEADEFFILDFDLDSDQDIIFGKVGGGIYLFENLGASNFGAVQTISISPKTSTVLLDIDSDNDIDFYYVNLGNLYFVENFGAGNFGLPQFLSSYSGLVDIEAFDFDSDLDQDLLLATSNGVELLENSSGIMLPTTTLCYPTVQGGPPPGGVKNIKCGDINSDGFDDIVVLNEYNNSFGWFENDGFGNFGTEIYIPFDSTGIDPSNSSYFSLKLDDLNNNGELDVLYIKDLAPTWSGFSEVGLIKNSGGVFTDFHMFTYRIDDLHDLTYADIDNDGYQDIIYTFRDAISWNRNMADSAISTAKFIDHISGDAGFDLEAADMDNDGDLDLVLSTGQTFWDEIYYFENLGGGIFNDKVLVTDILDGGHSIEMADFDGDFDLDIAYASSYLGNSQVGWIENTGGGTFGPAEILTYGLDGAHTLKVADLDGDNLLDLVVGGTEDNRIVWFKSNGNGSFVGLQEIHDLAGSNYYGINFEIFDNDQDGDMDIISSKSGNGNSPNLFYLENDGTGTFTSTALPIAGHVVNFDDIDNDGDFDLFILDTDTYWYENLGGTSFVSGGYIGQGMGNIKTADLNGDGDKDIIGIAGGNVLFAESLLYSSTQISGRIYFDANQNSQYDSLEFGLAQIPIGSSPQSDFTYTFADGRYFMNFSDVPGAYEVTAAVPDFWTIISSPDTFDINITPSYVSLDSINFGLYPDTLIDRIDGQLIGGFPRCNTIVNYWADYTNTGTTILDGYYQLTLDSAVTFISADIVPDSISGQNLYWHYNSLLHWQSGFLNFHVQMPSFNNIGDTLTSYLTVYTVDSLGAITYSDLDSIEQILLCAYDPNDKSVTPKGIDSEGFILRDQSMEYLIRFQNTGNDTALVVRIKDELDINFDWSSLEILASSHTVQTSIQQDGQVLFLFDNIYLPDSNVNILGSQGFVKYRIRMNDNLIPGTELHNTAKIFFDYNPPIVTNTTLNTIFDCSTFSPTVTSNDPTLEADEVGAQYQWIDCSNNTPIIGETSQFFTAIYNGEYAVIVTTNLCTDTSSCIPIVTSSLDNLMDEDHVTVYPNPSTGLFTIDFGSIQVKSLGIYDTYGNLLRVLTKGSTSQVIFDLQESKGIYYLKVRSNESTQMIKVVKL